MPEVEIAGTSAGIGSASGNLNSRIAVSGIVAGVGTSSGNVHYVTVSIAGVVAGVGSASGGLNQIVPMAGVASGSAITIHGLVSIVTPPTIFTPEINWLEPLLEEREFETSLFIAHDDTEQRESLTDDPNRRLSYLITPMDVRESGLLEALVWGGQAIRFWVPYWRGARYLNANVSIGATVLQVDTRFAGFEVRPGAGAMLFRDAHTAEVVSLSSKTDSTLEISPTIGAWNGLVRRDKVVPVFWGRLAPEIDLDYVAKWGKVGRVIFDLEIGD